MKTVTLVSNQDNLADLDEFLLKAVAKGDHLAFRRLHSRYYTRVLNFSFRIVQKTDRAEEVANDTMLAVWRGAAKFQGRAKVSTWIFSIAYRTAIKSKRFFLFERNQEQIDDRFDLKDESVTPIETLFEHKRVQSALSELPAHLRAVVQLTYYDGMSYAEIAQIVGCAEGTVKSRMSRAREMLRGFLGEGTKEL
ncbi:MAG: sigma-70 family RNA polymerase sigma factor [Pseudomonadota bacterium]